MRGYAVFFAAVAVVAGCGGPSEPEGGPGLEPVSLSTSDGFRLEGYLVSPEARAAGEVRAGVVLLHMLNRTAKDWEPLARRLAGAGLWCVAVDLRGHGKSTRRGDAIVRLRDFTSPEQFRAMVLDAEAARNALVARGIPREKIAVVGASIGANVALGFAAERAEVPAVVLLAPGLDFRGVGTEEPARRFAGRSALLAAAEGDEYSARSARELAGLMGTSAALKLYPGAEHGTDMFASQPGLAALVTDWLVQVLATEHPPAGPGSPPGR